MERHSTTVAHKPYTPPTFPVSFSQPPAVNLTTSQSAAIAAAAPAAAVPQDAPATLPRKQIEPRTNPEHDWYQIAYDEPEARIDKDFAATVDSIVLAGNDYAVLTRLQNGTLRTDRREATPTEIEQMERDKRRRQANHYEEIGSSQPATDVPPTSPSTPTQTKG
jgi:hypothetical protein